VIEKKSRITGGFWGGWQDVNARSAIFHQCEQLEKTGCIDNFRILAEGKPVLRRGWFFADSDAYKWLEAAYRILEIKPDPQLSFLVEDFIRLIQGAQEPDGYLFTFNQIHFPGTRWINLQIEHELYCHGHLIEACLAGYRTTGQDQVLTVGRKAADCIVADFTEKGPQFTAGHEEIEIALLRLFEVTGDDVYRELAGQFLECRGKAACFGYNLIKQAISNNQRVKSALKMASAFDQGQATHALPPSNAAQRPPLIGLRFLINTLSGKYMQQHRPFHDQTLPVGHAVRFAYLQTAAAMYDRLTGGSTYRNNLVQSWEHMVDRRMYITGGIGSLPEIEGFGRDYELDPAIAYAETCAALGSLFWNREMATITRQARYSDLYEWQLYNAALVGMGMDGKSYLYNNPLETKCQIERRDWYQVPCCPSNLSRTWAGLQGDILALDGDALYIQQYISSQHQLSLDDGDISLIIDSGLPWKGQVNLHFQSAPNQPFDLKLRKPSWAGDINLRLNGAIIQSNTHVPPCRLMPQNAEWLDVNHAWAAGDQLRLEIDLPVRLLRTHPRVKHVQNRVALARGPLIYCLESIDNPGVDLFSTVLDPESIKCEASDVLGGTVLIKAVNLEGAPLIFIPYHLWGNRGPSQMSSFVHLSN
jgi:uncharacterized protein